MLRFLLFITLVYFVFKILQRFIGAGNQQKNKPNIKEKKKPENISPPYDPKSVEDINYTEVKKKK